MKTSSYFEDALFRDDATATEDFFAGRAGHLFEVSKERSSIEFHIQLPPFKKDLEIRAIAELVTETPEWDSELESDSNIDPSSPTDHVLHPSEPPRYKTGAPAFRKKISDVKQLSNLALVSIM